MGRKRGHEETDKLEGVLCELERKLPPVLLGKFPAHTPLPEVGTPSALCSCSKLPCFPLGPFVLALNVCTAYFSLHIQTCSSLSHNWKQNNGNKDFLEVHWLRLWLLVLGVWVQSLVRVGEVRLRSHMLWVAAKKLKTTTIKNIYNKWILPSRTRSQMEFKLTCHGKFWNRQKRIEGFSNHLGGGIDYSIKDVEIPG